MVLPSGSRVPTQWARASRGQTFVMWFGSGGWQTATSKDGINFTPSGHGTFFSRFGAEGRTDGTGFFIDDDGTVSPLPPPYPLPCRLCAPDQLAVVPTLENGSRKCNDHSNPGDDCIELQELHPAGPETRSTPSFYPTHQSPRVCVRPRPAGIRRVRIDAARLRRAWPLWWVHSAASQSPC